MENPVNHKVRLQCFRLVRSNKRLNTGVSSEPEQQQTCQPESIQETPEPRRGAPTLADIDIRIQQLENRCLLLQKMQHCIKKEAQNCKGTTKESESLNKRIVCHFVHLHILSTYTATLLFINSFHLWCFLICSHNRYRLKQQQQSPKAAQNGVFSSITLNLTLEKNQ